MRAALPTVLTLIGVVGLCEFSSAASPPAHRLRPIVAAQDTTLCACRDLATQLLFSAEVGGEGHRCEIRGEMAGRVLDSTHVAIAMRDSRNRGLVLAVIETSSDDIGDRRWNWFTREGSAVIASRELYVPAPAVGVPSLAFGRFADALAARYPDAVRIGVLDVFMSLYPDLRPRDLFEMRPASGCGEKVSEVRHCMEAGGRKFVLAWGWHPKRTS